MVELNVPICIDKKNGIYSISKELAYDIYDFDYLIPVETELVVKREQGKSVEYYNIPCAFDIETTTIGKMGFMYHWQFCLFDRVVFGRTWEEFMYFFKKLIQVNEISSQKRLVIYVHALDFEFTFMYHFLKIAKCFFKDKHKPLYVLDGRGLEFRCSYFLSNMSLAKFCESSKGCVHYKLSGDDYDYKKIRYPDTPMDEVIELPYCYNDVRGLSECINAALEEDTIVSIPLTSTGYVRRDVKKALKGNKSNFYQFKKLKLNADLYYMCHEAVRGGNCHASRWFSGLKVGTKTNPVYSFDIKSSYLARALLSYYPVGVFTWIVPRNKDEAYQYMDRYCCLMYVEFYYLNCPDTVVMPYIPLSKCKDISKDVKCDNGRVLSASLLSMYITEIDFKIIKDTYEFVGFKIHDFYVSKKGLLPVELREVVLDYFYGKCTLEDVDEYLYIKSKNKLNGIYGMMIAALVHSIITFDDGIWTREDPDLDEALDKYYNNYNNILTYQHGLYMVTAARYELQVMLDRVGEYAIYCDTDSIKFLGKHNIEKFIERNKEIMEDIECVDIKPIVDYKGKRYIMGNWEREDDMYGFKTLGAKKYCYNLVKDGSFHVTVSGMNKKLGIKAVGNADNFFIGKTYSNVGRTVSYYNYCAPHTERINGHEFLTASNIGVVDTTYTLGVTNEYYELILDNIENGVDINY